MSDFGRLLLTLPEHLPQGRVTLYGTGDPGLLRDLTSPERELIVVEETLSAAALLSQALQGQVLPTDGLPAGTGPFDAVVMRLVKGRVALALRLREAWAELGEGCPLFLYGANREGVKSAARAACACFGNVEVVRMASGGRLLRSLKDSKKVPPPVETREGEPRAIGDGFFGFQASVGGTSLAVASRPGVFSWGGLDPGTELLLSHAAVAPGDSVLDLGCGCGVVGAWVGCKCPTCRLMLCDDQVAAVRSAERTLALNHVRGEVVLSDGPPPGRFDRILFNAPVHRGTKSEHSTAAGLVKACRRALGPGGSLDVVAVRGFRVENSLGAFFATPTLLAEEGNYHLWRAWSADGDVERAK